MSAFGKNYTRFAGKRVFITGHTGFKGAWLAQWLTALGAEVTGYALPPAYENSLFDELGLEKKITHHAADIRDYAKLNAALQAARPEIVFHLAAQALVRKSYADPLDTFTTNMVGGANICEAVRHLPSVKSLVFITSDKVYWNKEWVYGYRENDELGGKDPYSGSKAATELVFRSYFESYLAARDGLGAAVARAGNVIGGGDWSADRLIPDCIRALRKGDPIVIRNPYATRPWQFVLEPLSGYMDLALALLDQPKKFSSPFNFGPAGDGMFLNVQQVSERVISRWGSGAIKLEVDPNAAHEAQLLHLCIDKAMQELHWHPAYSGAQAIEVTTDWYRQRRDGAAAIDITTRQIQDYVAAREARV